MQTYFTNLEQECPKSFNTAERLFSIYTSYITTKWLEIVTLKLVNTNTWKSSGFCTYFRFEIILQ